MESTTDCLLFLLINLLLSVFKKLFQCYIQEGKHKAVVIGQEHQLTLYFHNSHGRLTDIRNLTQNQGLCFPQFVTQVAPDVHPFCNVILL